jgi:hypothetical protein
MSNAVKMVNFLFDSNINYRKVKHFAFWLWPSVFWYKTFDGFLIGIVFLRCSYQWMIHIKREKNESNN